MSNERTNGMITGALVALAVCAVMFTGYNTMATRAMNEAEAVRILEITGGADLAHDVKIAHVLKRLIAAHPEVFTPPRQAPVATLPVAAPVAEPVAEDAEKVAK